jgi:recombination protein RecT
MSNAVAQQQQRPVSKAKQWLQTDAFKTAVSQVVPKHITPERYVRAAMTAMTRVPKLAECDETSFTKCLLQLAEYGLEPDGRRAHLIPRWNTKAGHMECTLIIDWKGLAELVMRSGLVSTLHADVVCENDEFEYDKGVIAIHKIDFRKPRGNAYAVYAMCRMKDGTEKCDVMSMDEVEAIRKRSQSGNNGPWVTDFSEMAKKSIFRRLSKWLPLSPEIRSAAENDDDVIDIEPQNVRRVNSTDSEGLANALEDMLAKSSADQQHVAAIEDQQPQVLDTTVVDDREKVPVQQQREPATPKGKKASPADALVAESLEAADEKQLDDIVKRAGSLETEQQRMKVYLACDARKKELQKST